MFCNSSSTDTVLLICAFLAFCSLQASCRCINNTDHSKPGCIKIDPDVTRNVTQLIKSRGFPVETYEVLTEDGFILGVQRIPYGKKGVKTNGSKPVVFLQHGLLADATNWVTESEDDSLGYILADKGFDVWLGNIRGNTYSRKHVRYTPADRGFWDWSFEEMADYDIPAMINFALKKSGQEQLYYIGHSQGTLVGFLSFSEHPEVAKKVKQFFALAPIYHLGHVTSFVKDAALTLGPVQELLLPFGPTQFLPGFLLKQLTKLGFCGGKYSEKLCYDAAELIFGFDDKNQNMTRVPVLASHWPAGTSFKNIIHFGQVIYDNQTRRFNYGKWGNRRHYHQDEPPAYNVSKMTTPTAMFVGQHDSLSVEADVLQLKEEIQKVVTLYQVIPEWNHIDFVLGMDAAKVLYRQIIKIIESGLDL
ncbi:putative lysosomal acid lipase/cholesteryl ester hydrolase [Actinia tenebrosa]|uniref:Lipase n=1 Tax=Actinia tenebrosa TaxID=6105 RepID=A0A6P8HTU1_ACTTE|nr:putative lysosomal acid lipase/cholesteryl ester hydrolase [Actinia tenebrosa]